MTSLRPKRTGENKPPKLVVMLAYDGANALDIVGPLDVLSGSIFTRDASLPDYLVEIASPEGGLVCTSPGGLKLETKPLTDFATRAIDTLMVAGCENIALAQRDTHLIDWLKQTSPHCRRTASVCTGAFLLAEAGILNARRATTHWKWADTLAKQYPAIQVEPDRIYVKDDHIFTSAGITAGMDLALALIEEDLGIDVAMQVARNWVMFLKRPGGQSQFSALIPNGEASSDAIAHTVTWIHDHLDTNLSVEVLAAKCKMSARNFARRFHKEIGVTPGKYVESIRLQAARSHLETTGSTIAAIADVTGFTNSERMRRVFLRRLNVSPQDYRTRFRY
jgi:transcriptional regulator GlxA family with amidase domain